MVFSAFFERGKKVDYYLRPTGERKSLYEETRKTSEILRGTERETRLSRKPVTSGSVGAKKKRRITTFTVSVNEKWFVPPREKKKNV